MKLINKLIKDLEKQYPDKIPKKELSLYQYGYKTGQQNIISIIKFYKDKYLEESK